MIVDYTWLADTRDFVSRGGRARSAEKPKSTNRCVLPRPLREVPRDVTQPLNVAVLRTGGSAYNENGRGCQNRKTTGRRPGLMRWCRPHESSAIEVNCFTRTTCGLQARCRGRRPRVGEGRRISFD